MNLLIASVLSSALLLPPVMPKSSIVRGQRGECQTVFEGHTVEPFPFVVKGLMKDFLGPGKDVVLVRLEGDKAEFTGVVAGMSGSPCSIDGKLVGALSYAFAMFAKEPIAGITPYDSMADVMRLPPEHLPWRGGGRGDGREGDGIASAYDWFNNAPIIHSKADAHVSGWENPEGLQPIRTPLTLGGVPQSVVDTFSPWLRRLGFEPVAGGGVMGRSASSATAMATRNNKSTAAPSVSPALVPGGAVSAILVQGDVNIAATGTVTSVEGNNVLAFGHPFLGVGAVSIPMAQAEIVNTMVSSMRSFKMALTGPIIGELTQDRLTAIGGVLGRAPPMIPVTGNLTTPQGKSHYQFDVARDVALSPRFVAMALASALQGRVDVSERGLVRLRGEITLRDQKPIVIRDAYASQRDGNLLTAAALDMAQSFAVLWDTPFGAPPEARLHVDVQYDAQPVIEWIEEMYLDRSLARPGETITLSVRIRQDDGPLRTAQFRVPVPPSWRGRAITFAVGGADEFRQLEREIGGALRPTDVEQIGTWLNARPSNGYVYLAGIQDSPSLRAGVDLLPSLPPSAAALMAGDPAKELRSQSMVWRDQQDRPGVISGMVRRTVRISAF